MALTDRQWQWARAHGACILYYLLLLLHLQMQKVSLYNEKL